MPDIHSAISIFGISGAFRFTESQTSQVSRHLCLTNSQIPTWPLSQRTQASNPAHRALDATVNCYLSKWDESPGPWTDLFLMKKYLWRTPCNSVFAVQIHWIWSFYMYVKRWNLLEMGSLSSILPRVETGRRLRPEDRDKTFRDNKKTDNCNSSSMKIMQITEHISDVYPADWITWLRMTSMAWLCSSLRSSHILRSSTLSMSSCSLTVDTKP